MALIPVKPHKSGVDRKTDFYGFVRWTLLLCRCLGLLPITGLRNENSEATRYEHYSY